MGKNIRPNLANRYACGNEENGHPRKAHKLSYKIYSKPQFKVEMDGDDFQWYTQHTGIRQGCPLSPYLFLIVMTVIFHDVHARENVRETLQHNRILGAVFDEVLYADDTIIFSESAEALEELLAEIEREGENIE